MTQTFLKVNHEFFRVSRPNVNLLLEENEKNVYEITKIVEEIRHNLNGGEKLNIDD